MTTNRRFPHRAQAAAGGMPRLLTLRDVTEATALSRSVIYDLMAESRFPKPIRVGDRAVRWIEDEVIEYIASRPRAGSERSV